MPKEVPGTKVYRVTEGHARKVYHMADDGSTLVAVRVCRGVREWCRWKALVLDVLDEGRNREIASGALYGAIVSNCLLIICK